MNFPRIPEEAKDWIKIFVFLFACVYVCSILQAIQQPKEPIRIEIQVDDRSKI